MQHSARPGDVLADRYRLEDLLTESGSGRFWRAHDRVLERHVALHCLDADDPAAERLLSAARLSATVHDRRLLRVLDADTDDGTTYVVHEWGAGTSVDILVPAEGPLPPRRAAWVVSEVADALATAHEQRVAHGRLIPENVLIDETGQVRLIGFCVDAALLGVPPDRVSEDVTDLGALLYFLLTGRWAGQATTAVPDAIREHGRWLRPRQVRAGVPRVLDSICDEVLNPFDADAPGHRGANLHTARGLADTLREYVGDTTGLIHPAGAAGAGVLAVPERRPPGDRAGEPMAAADATRPVPIAGGAAEPDRPTADPAPTARFAAPAEPPADEPPPAVVPPLPAPEADAEPSPTVGSPDEPRSADQSPVSTPPSPVESPLDVPTQAGMPIFDDESDEVDWLQRRREKPPPPPAFEDPPERPLFAPVPEDGGPVRRPRPGAAAPTNGDHWPWETTGPGTGSGIIPVTEDDEEDDEVPGRSWFRLAGLVALALLVLVGGVVAFNLGRGKTPLGAEPEDPPAASGRGSAAPTLERVAGLSARDFDPQGETPDENPELAPLAVDGDPATAWRTSTYFDQFGPPPGLKTGVGLVVDLGESREVGQVDLTTVGSPTRVGYFLSDEDPTTLVGLDPVASGVTEGDRLRTRLPEPVTGQYLVVWLTRLPPVGADFRGEVAEVVVSAVGGADR